ncbi:TcfC E-set like domain-containing protein [Candidatus Venteria ishoeyi]|uniref:TcfC E-set like domain-containing protein n=1 Tax=Candidatus Venteria ishoeyi TaxID=1899563 RepID=UPI0025A4F2E8|nr:TcfC E-set like domain-containing protein [Candidatus Venteria ishoeyi]MDM8547921.1 TcfC E-set like domain-containing protein [Candidatus Venteria ishoeyi]
MTVLRNQALKLFISIYIVCLCNSFAWSKDKVIFQISDEAPPGFEDLTAPQTTEIDIFYGSQNIGGAFVTYTPNSIEFVNPETPKAITDVIPDILDKNAVISALTGPLEPHSALICIKPGRPKGCGILEPEVTGLIFDADRFRADIFINKNLLALAGVKTSAYLPAATAEYSTILGFNGTLNGTDAANSVYNLSLLGITAYRHWRLQTVVNTNSEEHTSFDGLFAEADWLNHQASFGLLQFETMPLLKRPKLLGSKFSTSTRSRLNLEQVYGNALTLFLPRRSKVQIYRDHRLLSGKIYDIGNQALDTSDLPNGSYQVELIIEDIQSGEVRKETRFFAKSTELPPLGETFYHLQAGFLNNKNQSQGNDTSNLSNYDMPFLHGGFSQRLRPDFGYEINFISNREEQIVAGKLLWMGYNKHLNLSVLTNNRSAYGFSGNFSLKRGVNINVIHLNIPTEAVHQTLLSDPFSQFDISLNTSFEQVRVYGQIRWRKEKHDDNFNHEFSAAIKFPILRKNRWYVDFELEYNEDVTDRLVMARMRFQHQQKKHWRISGYASSKHENKTGKTYSNGSVNLNWNDERRWKADVSLSGGLSHIQDKTSVHLQSDYKDVYGWNKIFVEHNMSSDEIPSKTLYGLGFRSTLVFDKKGVVIGSHKTSISGIIVEIKGTPAGAMFDVEANNFPHGQAAIGQTVFIPLSPYQSYSVRLVPHPETYVSYDTSPKEITLYPGNTERLVWQASPIFILIGKAVFPNGEPVTNAYLKGNLERSSTNADGIFQLEVSAGSQVYASIEGEKSCIMHIPTVGVRENIVTLDKLVCE